MNYGAGINFSSGWWVSIDLLRSEPTVEMLAGAVHLTVDEMLEELDRWASGMGLMYGVQVDRDNRSYSCVPLDAK